VCMAQSAGVAVVVMCMTQRAQQRGESNLHCGGNGRVHGRCDQPCPRRSPSAERSACLLLRLWLQGAGAAMPKAVKVSIDRGSLGLWGREVALPISGQGSFEVVYQDADLRVFRSGLGTLSVQVRQGLMRGRGS